MLKSIKIKITHRPAYNLEFTAVNFKICAMTPLKNSNQAKLVIFQTSFTYSILEARRRGHFQPRLLPIPAASHHGRSNCFVAIAVSPCAAFPHSPPDLLEPIREGAAAMAHLPESCSSASKPFGFTPIRFSSSLIFPWSLSPLQFLSVL